jgi:DNA-binding NarL/FixJ family response regulator
MRAATDQIDPCRSFARTRGDSRLRVIVADGSLQYMESVLAVLELHAIVDLTGRAANFEEIIELVVTHQPDVVLVDLDMPFVNLIVPAVILSTRAAVKVVGMYDVALPSHVHRVLTILDALIRKEDLRQEFLPLLGALWGWPQPVSPISVQPD